jgi:hypothetical protein
MSDAPEPTTGKTADYAPPPGNPEAKKPDDDPRPYVLAELAGEAGLHACDGLVVRAQRVDGRSAHALELRQRGRPVARGERVDAALQFRTAVASQLRGPVRDQLVHVGLRPLVAEALAVLEQHPLEQALNPRLGQGVR